MVTCFLRFVGGFFLEYVRIGLFEFCLLFLCMLKDRIWAALFVVMFCFSGVLAEDIVNEGGSFWDVVVDFFRSIFSTFTGQAIVGVTPIPATGEWHEIKIKNFYFGGLNEN